MRILLGICAFSACLYSVICYTVQPYLTGGKAINSLFWDQNKLFFVDTAENKICSYRDTTEHLTCAHIGYGPLLIAAPIENHRDKFLVGANKTIYLITWTSRTYKRFPPMIDLKKVDENAPGNRLNHAAVDPHGRLWIGTVNNPPHVFGASKGNVYSMDAHTNLHKQLELVSLSNGVVWNLDSDPPKCYHIDAMTFQVVSYTYHQGILINPEVIINLPAHQAFGFAGNLAIDTRGSLWVPIFGEGKVLEVDPHTKTVHQVININAKRVSGCAFGGPKMNILFVSTVGYGYNNPIVDRPPPNDMGGTIFAIRDLGVHGWPTRRYVLHEDYMQ